MTLSANAKNPIADRLIRLNNSRELIHKKCSVCGKQDTLGVFSWELVCVVTGLKIHTLMNIFRRARVSQLVLTSLLMAGLITQEDIQEQERFILSKGLPLEGRGGRRGKKRKRKSHLENEPQESSGDVEEMPEPTGTDPEGTL